MAVRKKQTVKHGLFFITFTCHKWLKLFSLTNSYDLVYKWFDALIKKNHQIAGYVIMPNHVHALIALNQSTQTINTIIANGKRLMAYEIVRRLKTHENAAILKLLSKDISEVEKNKGQIHKVFKASSDIKLCFTNKFTEQKLRYIHNNPCSTKWNLAKSPIDYRHSSMRFYVNYGNPNLRSKLTPYTAILENIEIIK